VARLAWEMELGRPVLRAAARFGRPVMEWGHDWVVANGVEQFLRRALNRDFFSTGVASNHGQERESRFPGRRPA
jgi:hypothetical protein